MRIYCTMVLAFLACSLPLAPVLADKRVALIIGNSNYQHVPKLANPANDAAAISLLLKNAGFDVVETRQNLTGTDMRRSMRDSGMSYGGLAERNPPIIAEAADYAGR